MRITGTELEALRALIAVVDTPDRRQAYRDGRFPRAHLVRDVDKRYRWDLFYAAGGYRTLDDDYTDAHIDTALRRLVPALDGVA